MKKIIRLICLLMLTSCCSRYNNNIEYVADRHREKLRTHFSKGKSRCVSKTNNYDIHSLIYETRYIAGRLRTEGRLEEANEFDSYVDVLMFGNKTIDESINDVAKLVNGETKKRSKFDKFIGIFCD